MQNPETKADCITQELRAELDVSLSCGKLVRFARSSGHDSKFELILIRASIEYVTLRLEQLCKKLTTDLK